MRNFARARRRVQRSGPAVARAAAPGPAQDILHGILTSAAALTGADQAFLAVWRGSAAAQILGCRHIAPTQAQAAVRGRLAGLLERALRGEPVCGDAAGHALPHGDHAARIATLCLPLSLGAREHGALCLMRRGKLRRIGALDWEILQALGDEAALAIGATRHQSALSELAARLSGAVVT
jgi:GAF domain-containing protein